MYHITIVEAKGFSHRVNAFVQIKVDSDSARVAKTSVKPQCKAAQFDETFSIVGNLLDCNLTLKVYNYHKSPLR